jgi:hypothetical protein
VVARWRLRDADRGCWIQRCWRVDLVDERVRGLYEQRCDLADDGGRRVERRERRDHAGRQHAWIPLDGPLRYLDLQRPRHDRAWRGDVITATIDAVIAGTVALTWRNGQLEVVEAS